MEFLKTYEYAQFDSLSSYPCTNWQMDNLLSRRYVNKMTGRLLTVQYQSLYLAEIVLEVRFRKNKNCPPYGLKNPMWPQN